MTWASDEFHVFEADTGKLLRRIPAPGWTWSLPVWSPEGKRFTAIQHDNPRADSLWIFDAETGEKHLAAKFSGRFHGIFRVGWGPGGKFLVVNRQEADSHIVLLENFQ